MKLVVDEPESLALFSAAERGEEWISISIATTEVIRATRRWVVANKAKDGAARLARADDIARRLLLIEIDKSLVQRAGHLDPTTMRSFDAIHLQTALDIKDDIEGIVTYDRRLADAAKGYGLKVLSPA